jgi:hypothetical protein
MRYSTHVVQVTFAMHQFVGDFGFDDVKKKKKKKKKKKRKSRTGEARRESRRQSRHEA